MTKITNPSYRKFLDKGEIDLIDESQVNSALKNVTGRHYKEGRSCLIALYFTGGRPNEVLDLKAKDLTRQDSYVLVQMKGSKRGLSRIVYLKHDNPLVKELYNYAQTCFPDALLFYHYRSNYERTVTKKDGSTRVLKETTAKLRYHVDKWFKGVIDGSANPYFLRHNRFSQLSQAGVGMEEIRMLKGARRADSVSYYTHLSSKTAKDIAKKIK